MVKETRIIFGIKDLVTVRFQCGKCKGEVAQKLNASESMPDRCPLCGHSWQTSEGFKTTTHRLLELLREALVQQTNPVHIRLDLNGEEDNNCRRSAIMGHI